MNTCLKVVAVSVFSAVVVVASAVIVVSVMGGCAGDDSRSDGGLWFAEDAGTDGEAAAVDAPAQNTPVYSLFNCYCCSGPPGLCDLWEYGRCTTSQSDAEQMAEMYLAFEIHITATCECANSREPCDPSGEWFPPDSSG